MGIATENRDSFEVGLDRVEDVYATLKDLLSSATGAPPLCTHQPPFGLSVDEHTPEDWSAPIHSGSIGLRLAIAATDLLAVFCGHIHDRSHDSMQTVGGETEVFNGEGGGRRRPRRGDPSGVPIIPRQLHLSD